MKKFLLSLFSILFLFGYVVELAPVTLAAHEAYVKETELAQKIADTVTQDQDGKYRVHVKKLNEYRLNAALPQLKTIINKANAQLERKANISNMMAIPISLVEVLGALLSSGLTALVGLILNIGVISVCKAKALDMYRLWSFTNNRAAYLFFQFCAANGWL